MAKNAQKDKEVVVETTADVQGVQAETTKETSTQAASTVEEAQPENVEQELHVQSEQGSGEQANDTESTKVDTGNEDETIGEEGNKTDSPVIEESDEVINQRKRIAIDVFEKNSQCKELHFTSDIIPFFVKSDAVRHGVTLDDDTVVTINRD